MGFSWTTSDFPKLADPHFIDAVGHLVHARQAEGYQFSMALMGYQALFYEPAFEELVKKETGIERLQTVLHEIRRGSFLKEGADGWELSFRADILVRNEFDTATRKPVGEVDYASDLEYRDQVLYATDEAGLERFRTWCKELGLEA
ncbi:hypothetical protein NUH88_05530 [Nisaea acidiphila]|uniref:Uncharacterized protein n=1 Tax=Nisaea acidiphila TaxID=1862145 RepID=A0A9J7AVK1_9PROT|nr:hypothetical protein [Nisaea acidiphila]UUX51150.1 hypothetical protein NUH88_05530 [Nisaea acidiphila]